MNSCLVAEKSVDWLNVPMKTTELSMVLKMCARFSEHERVENM